LKVVRTVCERKPGEAAAEDRKPHLWRLPERSGGGGEGGEMAGDWSTVCRGNAAKHCRISAVRGRFIILSS
jgi:hypothetical protein